MRLSATVCLIPELAGGPFLYSGDLGDCCRRAAAAGFDAVELLPPSPDAVSPATLRDLLEANHLALSTISTGAAYLVNRLHLCSPLPETRRRAIEFARQIIDLAGPLGGRVIVGVVRGFVEPGVQRAQAEAWLREGLDELGRHAAARGTCIVIEPLNRYESPWFNRLDEGVALIRSLETRNVKLLADLFHMNIEEASVPAALRGAAEYIGHVHFADSNRRAMGQGHLDCGEIGRVLREIGYQGCLAAEILPHPDADAAARQTVSAYRQYVCRTPAS